MKLLSAAIGVLGIASTVYADGAVGRSSSYAESKFASPERVQAANGHYARAQKLLLEAIKEFDAGKKIARPDLVVNPEQWRGTVTSKADELTKIISPQSRETLGGNRYRENPALINESYLKKKATPPPVKKVVATAVRTETTARARLEEKRVEQKSTPQTSVAVNDSPPSATAKVEPVTVPLVAVEPPAAMPKAVDPVLETAVDEEMKRSLKQEPQKADSSAGYGGEGTDMVDDDEIRARLKKLSEEIAQEEQGIE
jgi:hypothetical protein